MQAYSVPSVFNESIYFDYSPVPTFAGHINRYPFRVVITSSNDNPHIISLDSEFSKSYKTQADKSKWSFLRPEVKFYDLDLNEINHIITKDTKIYKDQNNQLNTISGTFMGVSGYAEFYFVDDLYNYDLAVENKKYSTIIATLQTSGINFFSNSVSNHILNTNYSNSLAIAKQPHVFLYRDPDKIKISENGIRDFINPRWAASNQYTILSFDWNLNYKESVFEGNGIKPIIPEKTFNKNLPSNTNTSEITIESGSDKIPIYYFDDLKVKYKNSDKYLTPGYCKTFFNIATAVPSVTLSATSTFSSPKTKGLNYLNKLWLSNPQAGQLSIVEYNAPHYTFEDNFYLQNNFNKTKIPVILSNFLKANIFNFDVPVVTLEYLESPNGFSLQNKLDRDPFTAIGYHSIDCVAVLPPPNYQAWAIDSDLNMLYKITTNGQILSAIDLVNLYIANSATLPQAMVNLPSTKLSPNSVTLDGDKNLWITLYDNKYVLNLDSEANFVFVLDLASRITNYNIPNINSDWYKANQPYPDDDLYAQNFIEPTFLDTDSKNKIWVTYSNYASGYLSKFDKNNNLYVNIMYPVCSCPQSLIVDKDDNVWVALSNNIWDSYGSIEKRDTNGNLLSSFGPILGVNELALDLNQNLWFTYSYSRIGRINGNTGSIYTFSIFDGVNSPSYFSNGLSATTTSLDIFNGYNPDKGLTDINKNTDETALEGIGLDTRGFLYVINSIANEVIVYDTNSDPIKLIDRFIVNPQGFNFWTQYEYGETKATNNSWGKSLQAHGDWTGIKWVNKYKNLSDTYITTVTGQSVPLDFVNIQSYSLEDRFGFLASTFYKYIETNYLEKIKVYPAREIIKEKYSFDLEFYKINENFDLGKYIKSFALTPTLFNSEYLFDNFLPSIYGQYPFSHFDLGVLTYEKISNFVINHSDVDVCNIENLYNLAESINENSNDYLLNYPEELKRLMDVLSINANRVFGSVNKNQNNFNSSREGVKSNVGKALTLNDKVTAGIPVILYTKSLNKFEIINTGIVNEKFIYSLDDLSKSIGLVDVPAPQQPYSPYNPPTTYSVESKILSSINSFVTVIDNKDNTPQTTPNGSIFNESYEIASQNILNYKTQLQQQIIDYSNYYYPKALGKTDTVLLEKCKRDAGLMVDSIVSELSSGVMSRSIQYALAYWDGSTSRLPEDQIPNQKANTIDTINILQSYIFSICNESPFYTSSQSNTIFKALENYRKIIVNLNNVPKTYPSGIVLDSSYEKAANAILSYKQQLQQQIIEYVKINNPTVLNTNALSAKCYRDVGYIVDALAADLLNNTNHRSIEVGNMYFKGTLYGNPNTGSSVPTLPSNQIAPTIDAINALVYYINGTNIPLNVPTFTTTGILSSVNTGISRQADIQQKINDIIYPLLNNGELPEYNPNGTPSLDDLEIANLINSKKTEIQNYVSDYVDKQKYLKSSTERDPILVAKCYRDVGYIIDAIAYDLANNANHRSIDVSSIYFKGPILLNPTPYDSTIPTIPTDQIDATIKSISALEIYINGQNIPSNPTPFTTTGILSSLDTGSARKQSVSDRIKDVTFTLLNGGNTKNYSPNGSPHPWDLVMSYRILSQKDQIQDHMANFVFENQYINVSDPNLKLVYEEKCRRDIGLMVDAIAHDLRTGVVSRSIQYALAYWDGSTSRLPEDQITDQRSKTINTVNELGRYILSINANELETVVEEEKPAQFSIENNENEIKWDDYYSYFEYVPTVSQNYEDNIVDWNNPQTTLVNNITSIYDWWGDEKYIDSLFSYNLYKGLNIF